MSMASAVEPMLEPSATNLQPLATKVEASSAETSFWVADDDLVGAGEGLSRLGDDLFQGLELELSSSDGLDAFWSNASFGHNGALGVGQGDNLTAQLDDLQSRVARNVTGTRDGHNLSLERLFTAGGLFDHFLDVVHQTVTGGLRTHQRAAPGQSLTGENTGPVVAHALVGTEEETDLTSANTNVSGRHVGVAADVSGQASHESNTESSDLGVRSALGVEVTATFSSSHGQASESVLEDALEAQKLQDRQVDGGVEPQTALVGAQGGVEAHSETVVDLDFALVVFPGDSEAENSLGDRNNRDHLLVLGVASEQGGVL